MSMQTLNPLDFITRTEMLLDSGWFRWLVGPTLLLVSGMWTLFAFRAYGALAFLIVVCLFIAFVRGGRLMPLLIAWPLCIASAFVPVDILPYRFGGQPRLVPVGIGCTTPLSDETRNLERFWSVGPEGRCSRRSAS